MTRQQTRHLQRVESKQSIGDARRVWGQQLLERGIMFIKRNKRDKKGVWVYVDEKVVPNKFYIIPNTAK